MSGVATLSKMEIILLSMLFAMTLVAFYLFKSLPVSSTKATTTSNNGGSNFRLDTTSISNSAGSATSGKLFSGAKVRSFTGKTLFDDIKNLENEYAKYSSIKSQVDLSGSLTCENWAVVTTIFEPSDAVRKQVMVPGWCLVVVGDKKGPLSYAIDAPLQNFVFLNATQQEDLIRYFPVIKALPWNR